MVFGLSMPTLALIGVFALPSPLHGPVALTYFLLFTLAILVDGIGALRTGKARDGWLSIGLGTAHVAGWIVWGVSGLDGIALPEAVGTVDAAAYPPPPSTATTRRATRSIPRRRASIACVEGDMREEE